MKICPKCQKTYQDEALNFCLDDGSVLNQVSDAPKSDEALPETVMINSPRDTAPNQSPGGQSQPGWGVESQKTNPPTNPPGWGNQPQTPPAWGTASQTAAVKPKSKSWMWVVGILAGVIVLCGGGLIGIIALVANVEPEKGTNANVPPNWSSPKPPDTDKFDKIDLSNQSDTNPAFANSEYKNGELILSTKQRGYYYVVLTTSLFQSENAITRLTLRNPEEKTSRLGYGLIFHSNPNQPLAQDYGFLIDTEKKRYRVVKHSPGKETDVVRWKTSDAVKGGTQKNIIEVRDKNGKADLYINGELVESIKTPDAYKGGVPGLYTGDAVPVAFSDFEISR